MLLSRRTFSLAFPLGQLWAQSPSRLSPIRRYIDSSTDVEVLCLSDPEQAASLPYAYHRAAARRQGFVVYSLAGPQGPQIVRIDLKGGLLKPLTNSPSVHPRAFALSPDDRTLYFASEERLYATATGGLGRPRELYRATTPETWERGFSLADNGASLVFFDGPKLQSLSLKLAGQAAVRTLAESDLASVHPQIGKSGSVFWQDATGGLHLLQPTAAPRPQALTLPGTLASAYWNPDGQSIIFLRTNQGRGIANSLHEYTLATGKETLVGKTSQFASFHRNGDSSVFLGASASKAQPYVLLMLRVTRRELALCEHKATDPAQVAPQFSADSKRIFFQSDRLGKSAIFTVNVEKLVEETAEEEKKS